MGVQEVSGRDLARGASRIDRPLAEPSRAIICRSWRGLPRRGELTSSFCLGLNARRIFEHDWFYNMLQHMCQIVACVDVESAKAQLAAVKESARGLFEANQCGPFLAGSADARYKARLAMPAWRSLLGGEDRVVLACCDVWPVSAE